MSLNNKMKTIDILCMKDTEDENQWNNAA